ncbi:acyltransferase 3 [Phyllosticta citribraziliensis]|uniref:Acyltransferase 3 n=1 Tax=Phyllosticta citribraziliensis TaxID=989973 RepID=A0ABR1M2Y9_9PEZI
MGNEKNVKWVEGLRGIASFSVIITHLCRAWYFEAFLAADVEGAPPRLLQMPFFRVLPQGRIGVTIFGFLTGFVCALKPLRLARGGQYDEALSAIAKSAFRRLPRLILPSTIAMAIAWFLAQIGAFNVAHRTDQVWIREASPRAAESLWGAVYDLWEAFRSVWTNGFMPYDDHQWAMLPLLKESMLAYVGLSATIFLKYKYRLIAYVLMFCYFFQDSHELVETFYQQLYFAMILCDFSLHPAGQAFMAKHRTPLNIMAPFLVVLGLYFASYPVDGPEWLTWSRQLLEFSHSLFPEGSDVPRRYTALGLDIVVLGLFLSSGAKDILSNKYFMWLGKNSFAVYLTHGTLLRTILVWMLYGISGEPFEEVRNEEGEIIGNWLPGPGTLTFSIAIPIWLAVVYTVAHLWTTYVDSYCAKLTQRLEKKVFEDGEEKGLPLV